MKDDIILCVAFGILTLIGVFLLHPITILNGFCFVLYLGRIFDKLED